MTTSRLAKLEAVIEKGERAFIDIGRALRTIRDEKLYTEYETFEEYTRNRWDYDTSYVSRLISAVEVVDAILPIGNIQLPTSEAQCRALSALVSDENRPQTGPGRPRRALDTRAVVSVWKASLRAAKGNQPTVATIEAKVDARLPVVERAERVIERARSTGSEEHTNSTPLGDCEFYLAHVENNLTQGTYLTVPAWDALSDDEFESLMARLAAAYEKAVTALTSRHNRIHRVTT
jgi:hypothetical protein